MTYSNTQHAAKVSLGQQGDFECAVRLGTNTVMALIQYMIDKCVCGFVLCSNWGASSNNRGTIGEGGEGLTRKRLRREQAAQVPVHVAAEVGPNWKTAQGW